MTDKPTLLLEHHLKDLSTTVADGRLGYLTALHSQRPATANVSDPNETTLNLRPTVPSRC